MGNQNIKIRNKKNIPSKEGYNFDPREQEYYGGVDGDVNVQIVPKLNYPPFGEENLYGPYGSGIRMGTDRINERKDFQYGHGYGGIAAVGCSAVDIYAGLDSWDVADGTIPNKKVNPNTARDASRVYISSMCDVDDQFDIPEGKTGSPKGKSAAVVISDHTRIVGREGVKIVSGIGLFNSKHKRILSVPNIELIAGNVSPDNLEPIPKGNKLKQAIDTIIDRINDVSKDVQNFLQFQMKFNTVLMTHTHPSPISIGLGSLAAGSPTAFCNGEVLPSYKVASAGFEAGVAGLMVQKDIMMYRAAMAGCKVEVLKPFSSNQINSTHVYVS